MANNETSSGLRRFGLELVGDVPWGTHLCQFYQTKEDLIDILVPYFKAGLESNEFCMWITAEPLNEEDAKEAMEKAMPGFSKYLKRGQIEIISYKDWYVKGGAFDCDRVLQGWTSKLEKALKKGYAGLRLTGNTFWLEKKEWNTFTDYEEAMNEVIGKYKMIAVCTYSLDKCNPNEIIDVIRNHQFALIKRSGTWALIESSERKKIAKDLLKTEQKFAALYNSMTEGVVLHDVVYDASGNAVDYVITDFNLSFEKVSGLSKKQAVGQRASVLYGTGKPPYLDVYAKVAASGKPTSFETYFPSMQKHFSISVFSTSKGKFTTIFYDITERKEIEQALQEAKRDWERTFDSIPDLIAILDKQHRIMRANKAMAQRLGTTPDHCIGLNCYECVHGTSMPLEFCPHEQTLKDGKEHVAEVQEPRLGGSFLVSTTPLKNEQGQLIGSVHVARDITERKKAEDVVRSTLERYRSFIEVTGELGWTTNGSGEVAEDIPSFRKYTGQTYEEVKGWGWSKAVHPDDVERTKQVWKEATATRNRYETEYRLRRHDGIYRYFMARSVPAFNEDGTVREWVGTCIDITDRKEREQELRDTLEASHRRQAEVSALLNASKAVLKHREFAKSSQLIFESCKELLGATAGYVALLSKDGKENEVLFLNSGGLPCTVNPSLPMPIRGLRAQAYAKGKVVYDNDFSKSEWAKLMPTGHVTLANVLFAPLIIENKTVGIIGLANKPGGFTERDAEMALAFGEISSVALINSQVLETLEAIIEERTQKLKASERLATIGETAGMVGHDIRNPLQAIMGEIYLAKDELTTVPESGTKQSLRETLAMIEEQIGYINKIVTDLQDFAKPLLPCMEETNLQTILQSTLPMINIPETVEVSLVLQEELPNFKSDTGYIKRVITNLISNAVQAMPKGGKLTVKTHRENGSAVLIVEDTGVGIPENAKSKLFQPLFTTKSKGQGFGLAVCKRLVDAMGGTITFESEEGKGTKFTVKLPMNR